MASDTAVHGTQPHEDGASYEMKHEAWNWARAQALQRLSRNAAACGADAVVGVRLRYHWQQYGRTYPGTIEWVAIGTAVARLDGRPPRPEPAVTDLSMAEYWKLLRHG